MESSKPELPNKYRPNFWGAMRDICVAALGKGQFLTAILGFIIIIFIIRMPGEDLYKLANEIIVRLGQIGYIGWILAVLEIVASILMLRRAKKKFEKRISIIEQGVTTKAIHRRKP